MAKQMDAWIIEWHKFNHDGAKAELYGYTIHIASVRKYLGDLYRRISEAGQIDLDAAFPGFGWGSPLQARHVRIDCDSELGRALIAEKAVRTHVNSKVLHDFHDEVDALANSPISAMHYVIDYIPMEEAQRHTRLRRARAKDFHLA